MSRLRPPPSDSYGLASRDDTRLLNPQTLTSFWQSTRPKVDKLLSESNEDDIESLSQNLKDLSLSKSHHSVHAVDAPSVLSDLRKLREALISLRKQDDEAIEILEASVKTGIISRHPETYLPSLLTLLSFSTPPQSQVLEYYALYLLFVLEDLFEFYLFISQHTLTPPPKSKKTENVIPQFVTDVANAFVSGNYIVYSRILEKADRFEKALILHSPGDLKMRTRLSKVIAKCYYRVEVDWFDTLVNDTRENTLSKNWEKEGNMYIIRRQKTS